MKGFAGWAAVLALSSACHSPRSSPDRAVIFVLADLRGYLGPCGCSERMRGGIGRAAFEIDEARRAGDAVWVLEGGDSLFDRGDLAEAEVPEAERRAQALAESFSAMGVAAKVLGPRDDERGVAFRKRLGLPEVAPGEGAVLGDEGRRLGVAAGRDAAELRRAAEKARAGGATLVIGFLAQPMEEAQHQAERLGDVLDLLVATHSPGELSAEDNRRVGGNPANGVAKTAHRATLPVVQLQSKGRSLLRLDVVFGAGAERFTLAQSHEDVEREAANLEARLALLGKELDAPGIASARKKMVSAKMDDVVARRRALLSAPTELPDHGPVFATRFVPLESSLPEAPAVKAIVERYDTEVGHLNVAWARAHGKTCPAAGPGEASFIGSAACLDCHPETGRVWKASKHHEAYATLEKAGKQFHTACVGCHVVGLGRPGGVCRIDQVEDRAHVGCESCHGPGSAHAADPGTTSVIERPNEARCLGCHTAENSPHFDFALYLPKILGPGHGRPVQ